MERRTPAVVAATPLTGHTQPMLAVARSLVASGRPVFFLGGSRFADAARATGARFVALTGAADFDDRTLVVDRPERMAQEPGLPRVAWELAHLFGAAVPRQHQAVQELLKVVPDAVVLHDMLFLGTWPVLLGAPGRRPSRVIGVGIGPLMLPDSRTTPYGPPHVGPDQDIIAVAADVNAAVEQALAGGQGHIEEILRGLGTSQPAPFVLRGLSTVPDLFAQLTVPSFEFPRDRLPATIHFVGPLPPEPVSWSPPEWWPSLEYCRVVVVTQGTVANDDLSELVQPTLDALAHQDVLVVAALGRDPAYADLHVPDNARVESFIPFTALFPHADVLVTNGGYGATQQALSAALPLVVAGVTEDKSLVASRIAAFGVGVDLATQRPAPSDITSAVTRVLEDPRYRDHATAIATQLRATDALTAIRQLIDGP